MKIISALIICLVGGMANGWVLSPRRIVKKSLIKKNIIKTAVIGGALIGGAAVATAGAAVVLNQINNGEVYEPAPGTMHDQVVVITGGSSGLGLETAKRLGAAGATVVLTSRTDEKGNIAVENVKDYIIGKGVESSNVYSLVLDLDSLDNVKEFSKSYKSLELGEISILVNNAGIMAIPQKEMTIDGNERTFQSNHLGHFILTAELFPYLSRKGAKVINVSSFASNIATPGLDMDNLNAEKSYAPWQSYGASKLANILFTNEFQRKATNLGLDWLTTVALHPGVVNTDLWRYIVGEDKLAEIRTQDTVSIESLALSATSLFTKSPEQGASTQIFLAATDDLVKGAYYEDMKEKTNMPSFAKDEAKASALWHVSEELGGIKFDLKMSTATASATSEIVDTVVEIEGEENEDEGSGADDESIKTDDDDVEDSSDDEDGV